MPDSPTISFHATLTGHTTARWSQSLQIASAAGFSAIDLVLPGIASTPPAAIREHLAAAGCTAGPASLPVEFRRDEDTFQRDLEHLPALARLAADIGIKTMFRSIPASSPIPPPELRRTLRRRVSTCATILDHHGIDFAIETLGPLHRRREGQHEFIWQLPDAAEFATSCHGDVGVLVDSWHWHHARGTVQHIVELGHLIRHVHVADAADIPEDQVRDHKRLLPGRGIIDHAAFSDALRQASYSRFISPEVRGYACQASAVACAGAALAAVRATLSLHPD